MAMSAPAQTTFSSEQRTTLAALADVLIPAADGLPAWSEVNPNDKWLERASAARPDLFPPLQALLDASREREPAEEARRLHAEEPEAFRALASIVSGSYYMNLKVRKRIGFPGQGKRPPFPDEADYDLRDGLLDPVIDRGPIHKPAPPAPAPNGKVDALPFRLSRTGGRADVLVIGAGAGGSVAARYLAEAGFRVVCLEQGEWPDVSEFPGDKLEFELVSEAQWSPDPNVRRQPADYPLEISSSPITPVMYNAVGGSTVHFCAQWVRMRPQEYRVRSVDGIGDDWPISYEEMKPYYERIDQDMMISGMTGDPAYPAGPAPALPPLPIGPLGRKAAEGMNRLGWHWWPAAHAIRSQEVGTLAACERTGTCMWGCPKGAKSSTDTTMWPTALQHGAKLVTGARVREILINDKGLATGAIYIDRDGTEQRQEADVVILGCNGVGTARLLLLSRSGGFRDGLANSSGLVGKRLMLHPYMSVLGIYEEDLETWLGPWGTQLLSLQFADHDESRGFPRGAQWDVMPLGGPLFALSRYDDRPFESRWGASVHELIERTLGHAFDWGVGIEDLPHESNTITLDPELTDSDEIPAPKVTFTIDDEMHANLRFQLDRAREAHQAAGAIDTIEADWSNWGWHLLGTARMGDDPATSVVDRWGAAHDVRNLYIVDGSVFVTSGPMAPTATICANALRCTDRLIQQAGLQPTPA
jgi:choline dehydrogenase-like flavoprotein